MNALGDLPLGPIGDDGLPIPRLTAIVAWGATQNYVRVLGPKGGGAGRHAVAPRKKPIDRRTRAAKKKSRVEMESIAREQEAARRQGLGAAQAETEAGSMPAVLEAGKAWP